MNRTIPIIRASRFAGNLLRGVRSGTVHSVYRRTINLQLQPVCADLIPDDRRMADAALAGLSPKTADSRSAFSADLPRLAALQDRDCVLTPLSLCTALSAEQLSSLPIEAGQAVLADADGIRIFTPEGMIKFEITGSAAVIDLNLASHPALPLPSDRLSALAVNINHILPLSPPGSFARIFCDPAHGHNLILTAAENCISKAASLLRAGEASSAADTLCRGLIGLGPGLTPAGDDFLCGMLAGLYLRGAFSVPDDCVALPAFARSLHAGVLDHLSETIDISAAFLRCACEGQFSEAIAELAADPPDLSCRTTYRRKIARRFSKIGHSSGFDTLAGISFVLRLTSDAASVP